MRVEPFEMERWQSLHEHQVEINLSDSGVHPLSLAELLDGPDGPDALAALGDVRLIYTQTNGTPELRRRIAALHPAASEDEVLVTTGAAEANFTVLWSLVEPGDEVVVMLPNYMQIPGLVRSLGARLIPWTWKPDLDAGRWEASLDELQDLVNERTRLIAICNPGNPTGASLDAQTLDEICRIAGRHGAWVLCDEIYRGCELSGPPTPGLWGRYERALVTGSLSKAYGLPGLRLGWLVAPQSTCADVWAHRDYTTIAPAALSDHLASLALEPGRRARLLERGRQLLAGNLARVNAWLAGRGGLLRHIPPTAGAMLFLRYEHRIGSRALASRLLEEQSVLVIPGDHFGLDGWLRVGFGGEAQVVERGLSRIESVLADLPL
ncbi:MAG: aminotransferase class I/II-fold pyridoxal phosphate-dependent enzyme [Planctomycetota bacterium]